MSPFQGTAPDDTYVRTDGTRTGLNVWENADSAGVDILATAHDRHDQDIASAINTVRGRIALEFLSEATAAATGTVIFDFTLQSGYDHVIVIDALQMGANSAMVPQIQLLDRVSAIKNSADAYTWTRHGVASGVAVPAFDTADASIALHSSITVNNSALGLSGEFHVFGGPNSAVMTRINGSMSLDINAEMAAVSIAGQRAIKEKNTSIRVTTTGTTGFVAGHVRHYLMRKA